ncbi:conserved hypothetical protein (plasmid) [Rhodoferax ferrireducens T118]|uniref:PIN-like domain-containing protein n=1 Tax=Albidiferax ferrireducens (strain ATCC BAA-621 / DSM 15236 / T118) TaxID=338969 RepID=Q21QH5_ALBFT|nr:PIN domain-containing protein [Rhodoferax ferrireducens]ABD71970.1 conserved hypothetical protein [Rhodoferax ferrireducens T118]
MSEFYLVDYENVGPSLRHCNIADDAQVIVFLGQTTAKIHPRLAQWVGRRGEYINIEGKGPNALDFHVAFYAGMIVNMDRSSRITVISRDKGFDPLLTHMSRMGVSATRVEPPTRKDQIRGAAGATF